MPCRAAKLPSKMYDLCSRAPDLLFPLTRCLDIHRQVEIRRTTSGGPSARPLGACCRSCILAATAA